MKLLIFLLIIGLYQKQDTISVRKQPCNIFIPKKKLTDTLTVTGRILAVEMMPQGSPNILYLERKRLLPLRHHYYSIKVRIDNCNSDTWLICGDNSEEATKGIREYARVKLTCIIFRDKNLPYNKSEPLIIVTKVR